MISIEIIKWIIWTPALSLAIIPAIGLLLMIVLAPIIMIAAILSGGR